MSKRATVISVSILAITAAAFFANEKGKEKVILNSKLLAQRPNFERIRRTKKLQSPIRVQFVEVADPAIQGQPFVINVLVESNIHLGQMAWEWHLPDGVSSLNSRLSGRFESFAAGEPHRLQATFRNDTDENLKIRFVVRSLESNRVLAQATYQTHLQKALQEEAAALIERQNQYLEEASPITE